MVADLYLRPNVQVEPLFDQWYAWSHLISPATAARNVTERHLKIMDSYIQASHVHAAAVKNPKMSGGPFIDYGGRRVDEIRALRDRTVSVRADLLKLSLAITELDGALRTQVTGSSLQPFYECVPDCLKGYVELVYDLNHHSSFRLIEPLLYCSPYYCQEAQSLMLSLITGDDRPFVLSTPRLETPGSAHLALQFSDAAVDELFRLKSCPRPWPRIRDILKLESAAEETFQTFLTTTQPPRYRPYSGAGARWRYFGHACILVETPRFSILTDPVLSYTYESDISRYTYSDLPDSLDFVLITHNHQDHVLIETLLQIRHKSKMIVVPRSSGGSFQDPSLYLALREIGFKNVVEVGEFDEIEFVGGSILGVPFLGEHADLDIRTKLAYVVRVGNHSMMFAADSCNLEPRLYDHIRARAKSIDVLFLGMECDGAPLTWLYGPLLTRHVERSLDESRRLAGCNFDQAMKMVDRLRCKEVYVYAMGQEPWLNHVMSIKYTDQSRPIIDSNQLIETCRNRGMQAERLFGEKEILLD